MKSLLEKISIKKNLLLELPYLAISIIVADLYYKFGSFTLELIGFGATWIVFRKLGKLIHHNKEE